jgi:alkanesulfonate monooxygenase SsuD/methylene tetrahydromethanopterin reductase-like flavin-dependent oxidoreductase (luciferase family)
MTDPGRRVLTRVGLRIPGWIASQSIASQSTNSQSTNSQSTGSESSSEREGASDRPEGDEYGAGHSHGFDRLADIATTAESSGFDSVWVTDNAGEGRGPSGRAPGFEPYTVLGALATRTRTVTLGAMVSPITARNPAVLAKIVTGVDVLSGGRAVLGVGMGASGSTVSGKDSANGQELAPPRPPSEVTAGTQRVDGASRLDSLAEGLRICRALFTDEAPTFEGHYYRIEDAHNRPRPVRAGGIPILVGGGDDEGEEGVLDLVARYADAVTLAGGVETLRVSLSTLDRLCHEVGRDPAAISRISAGTLVIAGSAQSVADQVGELLEVGIDGVVFTMADAQDLELVEMAGTTLRSLFG